MHEVVEHLATINGECVIHIEANPLYAVGDEVAVAVNLAIPILGVSVSNALKQLRALRVWVHAFPS
jgi:hypothetical protein